MIKCPPSSANTWVRCHGMPRLRGGGTGDQSAAERGETVHDLIARILSVYSMTLRLPDHEYVVDGVELDPDEIRAVDTMVEDVIATCEELNVGKNQLQVEQVVDLPYLPGQRGKVDAYLVDHATGRIVVWDYKHGFTPQPARDNFQLAAYLMALCDDHDGHHDQHWRADLRVVQPRNFAGSGGPVDSWTGTVADFRGVFNMLSWAAQQAQSDQPELRSGSWCFGCSAVLRCPAGAKVTARILDHVELLHTLDLTPEQQADLYEYTAAGEKMLKAMRKRCYTEVEATIQAGHQVKGWTLEPGAARRQYVKKGPAVVDALAMIGIKAAKPVEPRPISEVEPEVRRKGYDLERLGLVEKKPGAAKLTRVSDSAAGKVFSNQKG